MFRWYVAKVKPKCEVRIQSYLETYGVKVYAPEIIVAKRGRRHTEYLFPGYAFVWTDPQSRDWPLVRWARGLSYFLPTLNEPAAVPESMVNEIRSRVEQWNNEGWIEAFRPGDHVKIEAGPLRSLDAIFQRHLDGKRRCEILVTLMERPQRVEVDLTDLNGLTLQNRFAGMYG